MKDRQALEIVNRIMEDDMETLAAVALAYAPDKTLQELWNATNIHGALLRKGWDEEEIARRYAAIMENYRPGKSEPKKKKEETHENERTSLWRDQRR